MAWTEYSQHAQSMQVPPDLASRLASLASLSGRSPEAFLREAISRLIESAVPTCAASGDAQHPGFVPQPQSFSVYE
jgi:hypothetical protein